MKRFLRWIAAIPVFAAFCCCSKMELAGIYDTVSVTLEQNYSEIEVESCIDVFFSDDVTSAQLEADINVIPYVEIYETRNTLKIGLAKGVRFDDRTNSMRIVVTVPAKDGVESISLSGTASFVSYVPISGEKFSLEASGASSFTGELMAKEIDIDLSGASVAECGSLSSAQMQLSASGASVMKAGGQMFYCNMTLSGASSFEGISEDLQYSVEIDNCLGRLSGASSARFRSDGEINCTLSGASKIYYKGTADVSGSDINGDGSEIVHEK